ncbi:hypothetical protein QBC34DRAFT_209491 [Podospora aff. communis PSN243]|uniref:Uncharacterized protein n=1 Tax=Podospora aff. communis PSN243 TaxID=3040156 RepID=A0AAV9GXY0_9PEZI|nr:hypothetical protein QBC34DRAFT_209491 [Podospora aff. communis PSN243]
MARQGRQVVVFCMHRPGLGMALGVGGSRGQIWRRWRSCPCTMKSLLFFFLLFTCSNTTVNVLGVFWGAREDGVQGKYLRAIMDGIRQQRNWTTADAFPRCGLTTPARLTRKTSRGPLLLLRASGLGLEHEGGSFGVDVQTSYEIERQTRPLPWTDSCRTNWTLSGLDSRGPVTTTFSKDTHACY